MCAVVDPIRLPGGKPPPDKIGTGIPAGELPFYTHLFFNRKTDEPQNRKTAKVDHISVRKT